MQRKLYNDVMSIVRQIYIQGCDSTGDGTSHNGDTWRALISKLFIMQEPYVCVGGFSTSFILSSCHFNGY